MDSSQITLAASLITFGGIAGSILLKLSSKRPEEDVEYQDFVLLASGLVYLVATLLVTTSLIGGKYYIPLALVLIFIATLILLVLIIVIFIKVIQSLIYQSRIPADNKLAP